MKKIIIAILGIVFIPVSYNVIKKIKQEEQDIKEYLELVDKLKNKEKSNDYKKVREIRGKD